VKKQYWWIIITFIIMQLSSYIGVPLFYELGVGVDENLNAGLFQAQAYWSITSFTAAFVIILFLLRHERKNNVRIEKASFGESAIWAVFGVFLAFFIQTIVGNIEIYVLKVNPMSENTQVIMDLIEATPYLIIVTSIIGPILEEIIFRKIIFGVIYQKTNFWIGALVSSLLFGIVHGEPELLLRYTAMGFTFAFLYYKTKRILVPIFAHTMMNTIVVIIQTIYHDEIENMMKQMEQIQIIIGGS